ncbi:MAG: flavin reductase family protein [Opitutales bacterium]
MEIDFEAISSSERYSFLTQLVVPRPIAWVTTVNEAGEVNAAPFSFFNVFGSNPAMVALGIGNRSDGGPKDTAFNIRGGGEFVINMVTEELAEQMVQTSFEYARGESELSRVGLTASPSVKVGPPRVAESPVHLECQEISTQEIGGNRLILGKVVHGSVDDRFVDRETNRILTEQLRPVGRMHGRAGYTRTRDLFEIARPKQP